MRFLISFHGEVNTMENLKVRDLMVPVDKFQKISSSVLFYDALLVLETVQKKYLSGKCEQRILLVENEDGQIIGKLSPIDLLRGLETNYNRLSVEKTLSRFGQYSVWKSIREDYNLWESPFKDLCRKAVGIRIKDFLREPTEEQAVKPENSMTKCFHRFIMNRHDSLFVLENDLIIGLIRFSDVYRRVSKSMKECHIEFLQ